VFPAYRARKSNGVRFTEVEDGCIDVEHDRILKLNPNGAEIRKLRCGGQIEAISN
jgi:hypothetical protein